MFLLPYSDSLISCPYEPDRFEWVFLFICFSLNFLFSVCFCFISVCVLCVWGGGCYRYANVCAVARGWPPDIFFYCFLLISAVRVSHYTTEPGDFCLAILASQLRLRILLSPFSQSWKCRCGPRSLASHVGTGDPHLCPHACVAIHKFTWQSAAA